MANNFYFSRDTRVFMAMKHDSTSGHVYEIPVLDGYSFSQGENATEVTLNEAADASGNSKRGRMLFKDSIAPAEWSFSTYLRPTLGAAGDAKGTTGEHTTEAGSPAAGQVFAVEDPLWCAMSAQTFDDGVTHGPTATGSIHNFQNSNKVELAEFDLYFVLGSTSSTTGSIDRANDTTFTTTASGSGGGETVIYHMSGCSVGSATINFDIDGIAQVDWAGNGKNLKEIASLDVSNASAFTTDTFGSAVTNDGYIYQGITDTDNYIRQKLTSLAVTYDASGSTGTTAGTELASNITYALTLTGGSITIENNINYLTPETLGEVNTPLGHVMGTRSISGNFTCYLNSAQNGSLDLFEDLVESTSVITTDYQLEFSIGGAGNKPGVVITMPRCHLEVPNHSIEDIISIDTTFHALPSNIGDSTASNSANEISIKYMK